MSQTVGRFQVSHSFVPVVTGRFTVTIPTQAPPPPTAAPEISRDGTRFVISISDAGPGEGSSAGPGAATGDGSSAATGDGSGRTCPTKTNKKPVELLHAFSNNPECTITVSEHESMLDSLTTNSKLPKQNLDFLVVPNKVAAEQRRTEAAQRKASEEKDVLNCVKEILTTVYINKKPLQKTGQFEILQAELEKEIAENSKKPYERTLVVGEDENDIEYYWTPLGKKGQYACRHLCVKVKQDPTAVVPGSNRELTDSDENKYLWVYFKLVNEKGQFVPEYQLSYSCDFVEIEDFITDPDESGVVLMTTPDLPFKTGASGGGKHPRKAKNTKRGKRGKNSKRGKSGKKGKKSKRGRRSRHGRKN